MDRPDFVNGSIIAEFSHPSDWASGPKIALDYDQHGGYAIKPVDVGGHGAARWMAAAEDGLSCASLSCLQTTRWSPCGFGVVGSACRLHRLDRL